MKQGTKSLIGLISTMAVSTSLLVACGTNFDVTPLASQARPPATSDPLKSEQQTQWEAAENVQQNTFGPVLETEAEQESFFRDLLGEEPSYNESQLGEDAEVQYQKNQATPKPPKASSAPYEEEEQAEAPVATPTPTPKATVTPPITPPVKPPVVQRPSMSSHFCENLNVEDGKGLMDLSALYNDDEPLAKTMPSEEIKKLSGDDKKNKFACILLPIAIRMNEQVYRQRVEILRLQAKKKKNTLNAEDEQWLSDMKIAYSLQTKDSDEELLKRVDIIPLPLLLAQAALESGWGRSKAAGSLNNLFGIHAYGNQPCEKSGNGACIRKYKNLPEGVAGYISLLNSGRHYTKFREARFKMRQEGKALNSMVLIRNMNAYNETPEKYVKQVQDVMEESNKLTQFVFQEEKVRPESAKTVSKN